MTDLEGHDLLPESELRFVQEGDVIVAHHDPTGVASQGETHEKAHEMITEAVLLYRGEIGESITSWEEEREALEGFGFTDDEIAEIREARDTEPDELPEFMQN